jgi:hypothetical protein
MEIPPPLSAADQQRCIITGKTFPKSQMIQTEHGWVSAEGRDTYYQCLRENVPLPIADGSTIARSDGKRIIVPTTNPVLPLRCVKTNQPVSPDEVKKKTLYWCPPWAIIFVLLNLIIFFIIYLIVRKKVVVMIPLSREGRRKVNKHAFISAGIALAGVAMIVMAAVDAKYIMLILVGILTILGALIYGGRKGTLLRIAKYNSVEVAFAGASREFLASLPPAGT